MQPSHKPHTIRTILQFGLLILLVLIGANYQGILDQYALATYHPSSDVAGIEAKLSLANLARAELYRAHPRVDDKATFNSDCDTKPHELELGCFYRGRIYVLRIDNDSLVSEMQVVTAHELLHAAWARMSGSERKSVGAELERVYAQVADDDLKQRMAEYAKSEPGEEANELHSILGTEVAGLSPKLEDHYSRYFSNRQLIVTAHARYQGVFTTRRSELEQELAEIRTQKGRLAVLNQRMAALRAAGQIASYNALVPTQNQMVDDINQQITTYTQGVDEYNALSKSLDSQQITDTETSAQ